MGDVAVVGTIVENLLEAVVTAAEQQFPVLAEGDLVLQEESKPLTFFGAVESGAKGWFGLAVDGIGDEQVRGVIPTEEDLIELKPI